MSFLGGLLGSVAAPFSGAGLLGGLFGGGGGGSSATSDPLAPYRGQYASMLNQLITDPSKVTTLPNYQFGLNQGLQAIQGSAAAQGMLNSGNTLTALQKFGQDYGQSQYTSYLNQLAGLASGNPAYAQIAAQQQSQTAQGLGSLLGAGFQGIGGFGGLGNVLGGVFSGLNGLISKIL